MAVSLAGAVPSRLVLVVVAWIAMKLSEDHASPQYTARQLEGLARHDWTVIVCVEAAVLRALRWRVRPDPFYEK